MTALACAAKHGHVEIAGYLLEEGAKLEAIDGRGQTPLIWAVKRGCMNVVRLLIDNGANVNAHDNQNGTPYTWALKRGHNAIVDLLIQTNLVSLEPQDKWYNSKTFEALETSVEDWATQVNSRDRHGRTLLSRAAEFGHEASALPLNTNGADLEADDGQGHTPLLWAAKRGHMSVVRLLLDHKACIEVKDSWFKKTSLSWAAKRGWGAVVQVLIDYKAGLAAADKYGQTALMWASKGGFVEIVDLLLKNGADIKAKDIKARDALMLAKLYKHDVVVRLLDAEHPGSDESFYALT